MQQSNPLAGPEHPSPRDEWKHITVFNDIGPFYSLFEGLIARESLLGEREGATTVFASIAAPTPSLASILSGAFGDQTCTEHLKRLPGVEDRTAGAVACLIALASSFAAVSLFRATSEECSGCICAAPFALALLLCCTCGIFALLLRCAPSLASTRLWIAITAAILTALDALLHWRYSLWFSHATLWQLSAACGTRPLPFFILILAFSTITLGCVNDFVRFVPQDTLLPALRGPQTHVPGKEVVHVCLFCCHLFVTCLPLWRASVYADLLCRRQDTIHEAIGLMHEGNYAEARLALEAVFMINVSSTAGRLVKVSTTTSEHYNKSKRAVVPQKASDPTDSYRMRISRSAREKWWRLPGDWCRDLPAGSPKGGKAGGAADSSEQDGTRGCVLLLVMKVPLIQFGTALEVVGNMREAVLRLGGVGVASGDSLTCLWMEGDNTPHKDQVASCVRCIATMTRSLGAESSNHWTVSATCGPVLHKEQPWGIAYSGAPVRLAHRLSDLSGVIGANVLVTEGFGEAASQMGLLPRQVDVVPFQTHGDWSDPHSVLCVNVHSLSAFSSTAFGLQKTYQAAFDDLKVGASSECLAKLALCRDKLPEEPDFKRLELLAKHQLRAQPTQVLPEPYCRAFVGWFDYENQACGLLQRAAAADRRRSTMCGPVG